MAQYLESFLTRIGFEYTGKKDLSNYTDDLKTVSSGLTNLIGLSSISVAGIAAFGNSLISQGRAMGIASDAIGISADALQRYDLAAIRAGASSGSFIDSLKRLAVMVREVSRGEGDVQAFGRLGISVRDGGGGVKSTFAVLDEIAGRINQMTNQQDKTIYLARFGFSDPGFIKFFENWSKTRQQVESQKAIFSPEFIDNSIKFKQNLFDINSQFKLTATTALNDLAPALNQLLVSYKAWLVNNDALMQSGIKSVVWGMAQAIKYLAENIGSTAIVMGIIFGAPMVASVVRLVTAIHPLTLAITILYLSSVKLMNTWAQIKQIGGFDEMLRELKQVIEFVTIVKNLFIDLAERRMDSVKKDLQDLRELWKGVEEGARKNQAAIAGQSTAQYTSAGNIQSSINNTKNTSNTQTTVNANITVNGANNPQDVAESVIDVMNRELKNSRLSNTGALTI